MSIARATAESKTDTALAVVGFTAQDPKDGITREILRHTVWVTFIIFKTEGKNRIYCGLFIWSL